MRILLIGEYSRLHNSLKEGLMSLGHEVLLVSDGDGFKDYPSDHHITAAWSNKRIINIPRQAIARVFKFDIATIERGLRFYFLLKKLKGFDVVQLINEAPIKTRPAFERYLLKKIFRQNKKTFLLSCGVDYISVKYMLDKKLKYSIVDPYFADSSLRATYGYIFDYTSDEHKKLHDLVFANTAGVIASDIDYVLPLKGHPKFLGLIPNPVNLNKIVFSEMHIRGKIIIFLGINRWNALAKGIPYFEKALEIIKKKYKEKVEVIVTETIPYAEYITLYDKAHIVLDQVYAYDQGYNALEAMAKGKVVLTGAETEFTEHYGLTGRVAVNALPDVAAIVNELSYLVENPSEITAIGKRARAFIENEHDFIKVAKRYVEVWKFTPAFLQ